MFIILLLTACAESSKQTDTAQASSAQFSDYECTNTVSSDHGAMLELNKVIVFSFAYREAFESLNLLNAAIGYNYGPNHFPSQSGYEYEWLSGEGNLIESFIEVPPIFYYPEDAGCMLLDPTEADYTIAIDFNNPEVRRLQVSELSFELVCENGSYQGQERTLIDIDLHPCLEALCTQSNDDPWCETE